MNCILLQGEGGIIIFIEERHQNILTELNIHGRISTREIQKRYNVSFDTARRDLRILEEKGFLKRTHGGALISPQKEIMNYNTRYGQIKTAVKDSIWPIVLKATSVLEKQDVVFINDPKISNILVNSLPKELPITVVTNSIIVAEQLRSLDNVRLFFTGGEIDKNGNCSDIFTIEAIKKIRFDKCFITSTSISAEFGLSIQNSNSINILNTILDSSKKSIGLYPAEKIGFESILSICPANKLDVLITNWDAPNDELKKFDKQGIQIIVTGNPGAENQTEAISEEPAL